MSAKQAFGHMAIPEVCAVGGKMSALSRTLTLILLGSLWSPAWQPSGTPSGPTNRWFRTFEGSDYGAFFDIILTEDGNILAVGTTNHLHVPPYSGDALLMKLTLEGDQLWEWTWGGDGYEQAWSVTPADDGGYYVFGETDSYGAGDRDFFQRHSSHHRRTG